MFFNPSSSRFRTVYFFAGSVPLAYLALGLFAHPCCLVRITIQIALMPKTCDTSQEFALVDWCHALQQSSLRSLWSPSCHTDQILFPLLFTLIPMVLDLLTPFPLPLYIVSFNLFSLSHRWPFVMSQALCLRFVIRHMSFDFLSHSVSLSQVHCLISFVLFV